MTYYGLRGASPPLYRISYSLYLAGPPNKRSNVWGAGTLIQYRFIVRNHAMCECIRQQSNRIAASSSTAGRQPETDHDVGPMTECNMKRIAIHFCRVSCRSLRCNSGAGRTTAAWIIRCGRRCIHHIEYIIQRSYTLPRGKDLSYVSGYERTRTCRGTWTYTHNKILRQ